MMHACTQTRLDEQFGYLLCGQFVDLRSLICKEYLPITHSVGWRQLIQGYIALFITSFDDTVSWPYTTSTTGFLGWSRYVFHNEYQRTVRQLADSQHVGLLRFITFFTLGSHSMESLCLSQTSTSELFFRSAH